MRMLIFALAVIASGCTATQSAGTAEPAAAITVLSQVPIPERMARFVFLRTRDSKLYVARSAPVYMGDGKLGSTAYGRYFQRDVPAAEHRLQVRTRDAPGRCEVVVDAREGQTYYFMIDPRAESFRAFIGGDAMATLLGQGMWVALAGGLAATGLESYAQDCGGLFRLYPIDEQRALAALAGLEPAQR